MRISGFVLVEIVVALMILASSVLVVSRMRFGNQHRVGKAHHYHRAVQLLEQKMTELELQWSQEKLQSIPEDGSGVFEREEDFSWSFKTQSLQLPSASNVAKQFGLTDDSSIHVAGLTTRLLSQLVWEVKVTVHYKKGKRKSDYSLTSYFVDYSKDIEVSAPRGEHPQ